MGKWKIAEYLLFLLFNNWHFRHSKLGVIVYRTYYALLQMFRDRVHLLPTELLTDFANKNIAIESCGL